MLSKFSFPGSRDEALALIARLPVVRIQKYSVGNHRVVHTHYLSKSQTGLRLVVTGYAESGYISVRLVRGDGRKSEFQSMNLNCESGSLPGLLALAER